MLPVYRQKDTLVHGLHPLTSLLLIACMLAAALLLDNPLHLALLAAGMLSLVLTAEVARECAVFLRLGLFMAALVLLINPLVNHQGTHVLVYGPRVPALGRLDITLEALAYGAVSGFRLLLVVAVFGLAGTILNPDELLSLLSRFSFRTSLSAALAVRLYPSMVAEAREIREVQLARGERLRGGGRWERARAHFPFWMALFQGSLDRAACIAESMSARGFGRGKATRRRRPFRGRDAVFAALSLLGLAGAVFLAAGGKGDYGFFPTLENPLRGFTPWEAALPALVFGGMALTGRCWKKWPWWRSRI